MRRSSSICFSPGPPRTPVPPRLALQVGPAAHQPRAEVLQPRQLDLQLAFVAARALGEDLEDQEGAVVDRQAELALEVALLRRAQRLVEEDFAGAGAVRPARLISSALPLPTNSAASGALRLQMRRATGSQAGGLREQAEFLEFAVEMGQPEIDADQNDGAFLAGISSDKRNQSEKARRTNRRAPCRSGGSVVVLGSREVDGATRHDGGDGVLVDHLGHRVAQAARRTGRKTRSGLAA